MTGKEYASDAYDGAERIMEAITAEGLLAGDELLEQAVKACKELGELRSKATLRTKKGTSMAYPVLDAVRNMEEAWEDSQGKNDKDDLRMRMDEFISAVDALVGAIKDRTVIMT